jgi:hypothetical protein
MSSEMKNWVHLVGRRLLLLIGVFGPGCSPLTPEVQNLARSLDRIRTGIEEYGTASISAPVLTPPDDTFKFDLGGIGAPQFYADAKQSIQSRVADLSQEATIAGLGVNLSLDPTKIGPYLSQLSQYHNAVTRNIQAQSLADQKQSLINGGAIQAYNLQVQAAQNEQDATKRAQLIAQAATNLQAQFNAPGPTTLPSYPTSAPPTAAANIAPSPSEAAAVLSSPQFSGFQGMIGSKAGVTISDREALFQAAGDNATAAVFKALGDLSLAAKFADKKVLLGAITVAVNPGWRTRRGYAADVSTLVEYEFMRARLEVIKNFVNDSKYDLGIRKRVAMTYGLTLPAGDALPYGVDRPIPEEYSLEVAKARKEVSPVVSAVSPMTQSQVQEDLNSRRSQTELALQVAAAFAAVGLNAQAAFFNQYARNLQQDVDAIQATVSINTYSVNGGVFGFEVGPRLRAIENPSSLSSKPSNVLERQSFPALVIFGFEDDDLRPRLKADSLGRIRVYERQMKLISGTTWLPLWAGVPGLSEERRLEWIQRASEDFRASGAGDVGAERHGSNAEATLVELSDDTAWRKFSGIGDRLADLDVAIQTEISRRRAQPGSGPAVRLLSAYQQQLKQCIELRQAPEEARDTASRYAAELCASLKAMVKLRSDFSEKVGLGPVQRLGPTCGNQPSDLVRCIETHSKTIAELTKSIPQRIAGGCSVKEVRARICQLGSELNAVVNLQSRLKRALTPPPTTEPVAAAKASAPKISDAAVTEELAQEETQSKRIAELFVAVAKLCCESEDYARELSDRQRDLKNGAVAVEQVLFPAEPPNTRHGHLAIGWPDGSAAAPQRGPATTGTLMLANARTLMLADKAFDAIDYVPIPIQIIAPSIVKHPSVSAVSSDFSATFNHRFPDATEVVTLQLMGKDLDALDTTAPAKVYAPKRAEPVKSGKDPVTVIDGPTVSNGIAVVHITIDPAYHFNFALQLKIKGGTDMVLTPPIAISRLEDIVPSGTPTLRRITGPANSPADQQIDVQQFLNVPNEVIKEKINEHKPPERRLGVDVKIETGQH